MPEIVFLPDHVSVKVSAGTSIQEAGRSAGLLLDAPCGGHGLCGKCKVRVGKQEVLACQYHVEEDVTIILPPGFWILHQLHKDTEDSACSPTQGYCRFFHPANMLQLWLYQYPH